MQGSGSVFKNFRGSTQEGLTVNSVKKIEVMTFRSKKRTLFRILAQE